MDERLTKLEDMPCFYAAMVLYFPIDAPQDELSHIFGDCCSSKYYNKDNLLEISVCEVDNVFCWEVTDVLTQLFDACDLERIETAIRLYNGSAFIDISFVHKDRYPALIFEGNVMQVIHKLQASIGIDPY